MNRADLQQVGLTIDLYAEGPGFTLTAATKENFYRFSTTHELEAFVIGFLEGRQAAPSHGHAIVQKDVLKAALGQVVDAFQAGGIPQIS